MGKARIQDEFTNLTVSRQRKYQLRCERDGVCRLCGDKVAPQSKYCVKHQAMQRGYAARTAAQVTQDLLDLEFPKTTRHTTRLTMLLRSMPPTSDFLSPRELI